jgi:hypothetical protein
VLAGPAGAKTPLVNCEGKLSMPRVIVIRSITVLVTGVVSVLALAVTAHAAPITLNFSADVDLSSEGGPAASTLNGSITWDSDAIPFESEPGFAVYDPVSYTLFFNGVDVSAPIIGNGTGSGVFVADDADPLVVGSVSDAIGFFLSFEVPFTLNSTGDTDLNFLGLLTGPTTMFNSVALPPNLDFLPQLTGIEALWFVDAGGDVDFFLEMPSTLTVSAPGGPPVPEPATMLLTLLGLGAFARTSRTRRNAA